MISYDQRSGLIEQSPLPKEICSVPQLIIGDSTISSLKEITKRYGISKPLVFTGENSLDACGAWKLIAENFINFERIKISGEPDIDVVNYAAEIAISKNIDGVIGIGGGSVIDAAKAVSAIALERKPVEYFLEGVGKHKPSGKRLPLIAMPTTSGTGSEATKNAVISGVKDSVPFKKSLRHDNYIPDVAIIDSDLLIGSPELVAYSSGMDALTQLLEAFVSTKASKFTDPLAFEGLKIISHSLPATFDEKNAKKYRLQNAYAAFLSGICLANAGLGLVHGYASELGSLKPAPHGIICSSLLSPVTRKIIEAMLKDKKKFAPHLKKYALAGTIFGGPKRSSLENSLKALITGLETLDKAFNLPSLKNFGYTPEELKKAAKAASMKNSPIELSLSDKEDILFTSLGLN